MLHIYMILEMTSKLDKAQSHIWMDKSGQHSIFFHLTLYLNVGYIIRKYGVSKIRQYN
jgi:hypothetical protein